MDRKLKISAFAAVSILASSFFVSTASAEQIQGRACTPTEVGVFSNRIHVKCAPIAGKAYTGDITYYAMALKRGSMQVQLTLEVLAAAKANKRPLRIWADMSDYQSVPGCKGSNCRRLTAAAIR